MYKIIFILLLLITSSFSKTIVTVTHPVHAYFIKKIAGNSIHIRTVYDKKHDFDLFNKKLIDRFSSSKYYFTLGLPEEDVLIEKFLSKNKELKIVNTTKDVSRLKLDNGKMNPYVWLDPILARSFAEKIYEELLKIRSYDKYIYKENYELFLDELDKIYLDMKKRIDESDLYGFFVFDNKLDYFAKRFRVDVYHQENKRLNIKEIPEMIKFSRKEHIKHIVIGKDSDYTIAQSFGSHINGKIVEVDIYSINWRITMFSLIRGLTNF